MRKPGGHIEHRRDNPTVRDAAGIQVVWLELEPELTSAVVDGNQLETHPA